MAKLWGGRFEGQTDSLVEQLGESISFDARLAPWDIRASIAHAKMLGVRHIIPDEDAELIIAGLRAIALDVDRDAVKWDVSLEDVHTNIEGELIRRIGEAGKRLHTARSRNDQIATDVRLWTRDQIDAIIGHLTALRNAFLDFAQEHIDVILPGFTHLQHAQPVLLAHHALAYVEMFDRDRQRFRELRTRVNVLPLGSAAMAGTPHPIDREMVARELGFDAVTANSMDAVADRDYIIEFCSCASIVMMHLSRLCEELILWSTPEFNFVEIGDAFTTGSSIMPQKKNPDVAELVRGKTGRVYGDLFSLLTLVKGLPLTYNRDLQEDKERLFDASDTVQLCVAVIARMLPSVRVHAEVMRKASLDGFLEATDLADFLAARGTPFRRAHEIIGKLVLYCIREGKRLPELTLAELHEYSPLFDATVFEALELRTIVDRRDNIGGTATPRVLAAIESARSRS